MKKFLLFLVSTVLLYAGTYAQANHVVISQVYSAGGNAGALFTHDFVELYNPTASTVDISGWSLQYSPSTNSSWNSNKVDLIGTIAPGKYFLIQLSSGGSAGNSLPSPDQSSTNISMATDAGKLALTNSTTSLTGACPSSLSIVDFVGYGSSANCSEGANAPANTPLLAISRFNNGCTDNDNNSSDFVQAAPSPRNSGSPANSCNGSVITISSITNMPFCVDGVNAAVATVHYNAIGNFSGATFSVQLSNANGSFSGGSIIGSALVTGNNPSGNISISIPAATVSGTNYRLRILADNPSVTGSQTSALEVINGANNVSVFSSYPAATQVTLSWTNAAGCFDEVMIVAKEGGSISAIPSGDGSSYTPFLDFAGNGSSFDGGKVVYKGSVSGQTITGLVLGAHYHFKIFTRRGTQWSTGIEINDRTRHLPQAGEIVINQLSPDFGEASDEYVEIVNTTNKSFDLSDLQFGYQSSSGGPRLKENLEGSLRPHSYWLLSPKETISVGRTTTLNRDGSINPGFAQGGGQIALLRKADGVIVDAVAYGSVTAGDYIEGSPAPSVPLDGGIKRLTDGIDNNANNADFATVNNADIDLRNSSSVLANDGAVIAPATYSRMYVTGNTSLSGNIILLEKVVLVNGVLSLGNFSLITESTEGGDETTYIKTNGTGALIINNITADSKKFPVGNSTWNPLIISNGNGLNWTVRVEDAVQGVTSNKMVQRTWHVAPSAEPSAGASLVFEYNDGDAGQITSGFNKSEDIQVWNFHNNKWQTAGLIATPTGSAGGKRTVALNNWTQFSPLALANVTGPLPIHFYGERAVYRNSAVHVSWSNLTEENVVRYEVERSHDGASFSSVGTVPPSGNNGVPATYNFKDAVRQEGNIYYRIKATEMDGSITYSRVMAVSIETAASFSINPNPVYGSVVRYSMNNLPEGIYLLRIYNLAGQVLYTATVNYNGSTSVQSLPLQNIKSGYYLMELSGKIKMQKAFIVD